MSDPTCPFDNEDVYSHAVLHQHTSTHLECPRCDQNTMVQRYRVINGGPSSDLSLWESWCPCGYTEERSALNTSDYCY